MWQELARKIKDWGLELGFQQIGITDTNLSKYQGHLHTWLEKKYHGSMNYMQAHGTKRYQANELVPGTLRIISARMDYLPQSFDSFKNLRDKNLAYISRYALGRDYHRLIRKRLQQLAEKIKQDVNTTEYRAFCDSAPVMEKPIAEKAGLGWIGKNTILIHPKAGSWFFLGELFTNLPLPIDQPTTKSHCGTCSACMQVCPTNAIVAPYQLDARLCISYLTIELKESIPEKLRPLIGNRIYGCDDCLLICPWNKFAKKSREIAFQPRGELDSKTLVELFSWTENDFLRKTEGSAIRRIGYLQFLRNIAVALGNAPTSSITISALKTKVNSTSPLLREHVEWALIQHL